MSLSGEAGSTLAKAGALFIADDAPAENNPTQPADGDARNLLLSTTAEGIWVWRCSQRGWYVATRVDIHPEQTPTCLCWAPWSHRPARQKVTRACVCRKHRHNVANTDTSTDTLSQTQTQHYPVRIVLPRKRKESLPVDRWDGSAFTQL